MIKYLELCLKQKKMNNSWLIASSTIDASLKKLNSFILRNFLVEGISLCNHPDYYCIPKDGKIKEICIEQIRVLKGFFYKTPLISKYRIAVICRAELMNIYAANSSLKILEEPPKHCFIFLLTSNSSSIIPTIKSRCAKLEDNLLENVDFCKNNSYNDDLEFIHSCLTYNNKFFLIKDKIYTDKFLWNNFCKNILFFLVKIIKNLLSFNIDLNSIEQKICSYMSCNLNVLIEKFYEIKSFINSSNDNDLNLEASIIVIIDKLVKV